MIKRYAEFMRYDGTTRIVEVSRPANGYIPMPQDCIDMRFFERTEFELFGMCVFVGRPKNYTEWESVILTKKGMLD